MNATFEMKKAEAVKRMKKIGIFPKIVQDFARSNRVSRSEAPFGAWYWIEGEELERIRKFESEHDAVVYAVIRTNTTIGLMDSYLYVSDYPESWEMDMEDINENMVLAYVKNYDMPDCSELGSIGIKLTPAKGLVRVW